MSAPRRKVITTEIPETMTLREIKQLSRIGVWPRVTIINGKIRAELNTASAPSTKEQNDER